MSDQPENPARAPGQTSKRGLSLPKLTGWGGLAFLGGFIGLQVPPLWNEWSALRREQLRAEATTVIGFVDVHPIPNAAEKPQPYFRHEGDELLVWAGWSDEAKTHNWFHVHARDFDESKLTLVYARGVVRAIDQTVLERKGETRWERLPPSAVVYPMAREGVSIAYPQRLMELVEVVNDTIAERRFLVVQTPFLPAEEAVRVFDPVVAGETLFFRPTGYFLNDKPILYDTASESFWQSAQQELKAIAGVKKGSRLPLVTRLEPKRWDDWSGKNPEGLLVVGADRREAKTTE